MNAALGQKPALGPGVVDFLKAHNAEKEFQIVFELILQSFAEVLDVEANIWNDADEENWVRIALEVTLPASAEPRVIDEQRKFHQLFVEQIPLPQCPLFLLQIDYSQDEG